MLILQFVSKITATFILHELNKRIKHPYTEWSHIRKNILSCLIVLMFCILLILMQFNAQLWCRCLISYTLIYNNFSTQITFFWFVISSLVDRHDQFEDTPCFNFQV